jgi:hypothetical protein
VRLLADEGVRFVSGTEIGKHIGADRLTKDYDAVVLAGGATQARELPVEGRNLAGIHLAMEFLHTNTKSLLDSQHADGKYIGFTSSVKLTPAQRELATAALTVVWDRTFQHRGDDLKLGDQHQGSLKLGSFKRSDDGKTYLVADWVDIDNDSQTLYFEKLANGKLRLAIQQING